MLESIKMVIGDDTVVLRDLEFAPPWIVREAYEAEEENWDGVYEVVDERQVSKDANVISSHVAYKGEGRRERNAEAEGTYMSAWKPRHRKGWHTQRQCISAVFL